MLRGSMPVRIIKNGVRQRPNGRAVILFLFRDILTLHSEWVKNACFVYVHMTSDHTNNSRMMQDLEEMMAEYQEVLQ